MAAMGSNKAQKLYLRVSPEVLSFVVYHPYGGRPPVVENYEVNPTASLNVNLREALATLPLAQENYSSVEVLLNVPYALKPIELFNEEQAEAIYRQCFRNSGHTRVFYDMAGILGAALIYGISDAFCRVIEDSFPSFHYSSTTTEVAIRFASAAREKAGTSLYAYHHEGVMDMFVFTNGELQLANRYKTKDAGDATYFVMLAVQTLHLNTIKDNFVVVDEGQKDGGLAERLRKFLRNVEESDREKSFGRTPLSKAANIPYDMTAFLMQPY